MTCLRGWARVAVLLAAALITLASLTVTLSLAGRSARLAREARSPAAVRGASSPPAPREAAPRVLVVTIFKNSLRHLPRYFRLLRNLTAAHPAARLSLSLADGASTDAPTAEDLALLAALPPAERGGEWLGAGDAGGAAPGDDDAALGDGSEGGGLDGGRGELEREREEGEADGGGDGDEADADGGGRVRRGRTRRRRRGRRQPPLSGTLARLLVEAALLRREGWASVTVTSHAPPRAAGGAAELSREARHGEAAQPARRAALARARNAALSAGLSPAHEWVLWLDSDVAAAPGDLLRSLLRAAACGAAAALPSGPPAIIAPNVVMAPGGRAYDLNSWRGAGAPGSNATAAGVRAYHDARDAAACAAALTARAAGGAAAAPASPPASAAALARAVGACSAAGSGALHLEGYARTGAAYLDGLRAEVRRGAREAAAGGGGGGAGARAAACGLARLDGVGGGALLVAAALHREGVVFPPAPYRHRVETEGLAMMALDAGHLSWGLPLVEVVHH